MHVPNIVINLQNDQLINTENDQSVMSVLRTYVDIYAKLQKIKLKS
jgi:hypothetical protein